MTKYLPKRIKDIIEDDVFIFKFSTAIKFTLVSLLFAVIAIMLTYLLLRIDLILFESMGFSLGTFEEEAYFDFVFQNLWNVLPLIFLVFIIIFISGYYIAIIMMRPFKAIGDHCEERLNEQTRFYQADFFSDLKLLTSFSTFFFSKIDEAKAKGELVPVTIPEDYTKIHKPIWERNFFINYLLLITIFSLLASLGILFLNNELRGQVSYLASSLAKNNLQAKFFLERQAEVESTAVYSLLALHVIVNILFGIHLYYKIASPSFAMFATLRSFLKGSYHNRVHLIGFYYLRNDCRKINKYLDYVQKELTRLK